MCSGEGQCDVRGIWAPRKISTMVLVSMALRKYVLWENLWMSEVSNVL